MEWVKVFSSATELHQRLKENMPQLLIVHGVSICLVKREGTLLAIENKLRQKEAKEKENYLFFVI